ncbi:MAG: fumarylacetoacetate hydrolase family protein [Pseudomonadota bacterium]
MQERLTAEMTLPHDAQAATLVGRIWRPDVAGPALITVSDGRAIDITAACGPTMTALCEAGDAAPRVRDAIARGDAATQDLGPLDALLANTPEANRDPAKPWLLAPIDLQAIKAAGVTFARSMVERVIEEQAKGAPHKADAIRQTINERLGGDLATLKPGSAEAMALKETLIAQDAWSQYLEVGIGEDAEIFTKAQPMSAVGHGMMAGIHPRSTWNNPEPEVVLVANATGSIVGATLGNDVNLRDFEGRSALLLSKAKDNNASATLGPMIRLFDDGFSLDDVRAMVIDLRVEGSDGFTLEGASSMAEIARDPADLIAAMMDRNHQYPDGAVLYLGTMFAPVKDRDAPGQGFTHKVGDVVTISTPKLGALTNVMALTPDAPPWTFGTAALMTNLAKRGLLGSG